jgi:AcrR family transcriptional regulator
VTCVPNDQQQSKASALSRKRGAATLTSKGLIRYDYAPLGTRQRRPAKEAAIEMFDEQGFENTSVTAISQRPRVVTRTFFRHFSVD